MTPTDASIPKDANTRRSEYRQSAGTQCTACVESQHAKQSIPDVSSRSGDEVQELIQLKSTQIQKLADSSAWQRGLTEAAPYLDEFSEVKQRLEQQHDAENKNKTHERTEFVLRMAETSTEGQASGSPEGWDPPQGQIKAKAGEEIMKVLEKKRKKAEELARKTGGEAKEMGNCNDHWAFDRPISRSPQEEDAKDAGMNLQICDSARVRGTSASEEVGLRALGSCGAGLSLPATTTVAYTTVDERRPRKSSSSISFSLNSSRI
ncbi:hypothetical protein B0H21DRAFT_824599 [Amylocystis lapponica]|nr:hypothetical protein B0H21DRAFT_824599 [Amylocystis lapponica]